jgi:polynucleotide 5'-kinase involved in rRNA processing
MKAILHLLCIAIFSAVQVSSCEEPVVSKEEGNPFRAIVIGQSGHGKTTLVNFLLNTPNMF